jgi:hypothetical protein
LPRCLGVNDDFPSDQPADLDRGLGVREAGYAYLFGLVGGRAGSRARAFRS